VADTPDVPPTDAETPFHRVKALGRAVEILQVLAERPMRPSDLSRNLGAPWATIYRTVRSLTENGWLQRDPDTGEYHVGAALWTLGTAYIRDHPLLAVAQPHLENLLVDVDGLLKLCERNGRDAVTLFAQQNPAVESVRRIRDQYRLELHCASFGQVLLAHETPEFIEEYLREPLRRATPRTVTDPDKLRDVLSGIREAGYAVSREESQQANGSVAVPLFRRDGQIVAALSAIMPIKLLEDPEMFARNLENISRTAATVSESLGWRSFG
jgi:DNA-binding IclR family transcriptional regulator